MDPTGLPNLILQNGLCLILQPLPVHKRQGFVQSHKWCTSIISWASRKSEALPILSGIDPTQDSKLSRFLRGTAYCQRCLVWLRMQAKELTTTAITTMELQETRHLWVTTVQRQCFREEVAMLKSGFKKGSWKRTVRNQPNKKLSFWFAYCTFSTPPCFI